MTGTTPDGRRTLVIWRNRPGEEAPEGVEEDFHRLMFGTGEV